MFRIAFYENGKFSSYIGPEFEYRANAISAITTYSLNVSAAGLNVEFDGSDCFKYDRYGTPCMVRIEKVSCT